ncbi:MAG: DUF3298 and DUF4163 domain-containing protein [Lachnospiraceae bacterium]|nr:DUF3298 and DUF4163 domain-containing protein [Lachnospiraceae bacterium]
MKKKLVNKNSTNKIQFCVLLLCASLAFTACGTDSGEAPESDTAEGATENDLQQPEDNTADENISSSDETASPEAGTDNSTTETDTSVSGEVSHISVEMMTEENDKTTEDGTVYLYKSSTYPVVTIEGNEAAAEKINADIRSRIDTFNANTEVEEWAKNDLEFYEAESDDTGYTFIGYSEGLDFRTARADRDVISFTMTYDSYTGGAHGNNDTRGINYNAKTGELISFSDLSDDPTAFHEDTLAYNQKLAESDAYKDRLFSEDFITDGTLESVLYADDVWYLSTSGLVFMSGPYALGSYAEGTIKFIIPYGDLADMGFNNAYAYTDRFVFKMQDNGTYNYDLNGDSSEDSIHFYSEYVEDSDGAYNTVPHLIVNDTDFASTGDTAVQEQITALLSEWYEVALYDLNPADNFIEIMFTAGEYENDEFVYYSHFFRYHEDGSLSYLGKTKGDGNDPTVDTSELTVSIE